MFFFYSWGNFKWRLIFLFNCRKITGKGRGEVKYPGVAHLKTTASLMEYLPSTVASTYFLDFCTFTVHAKRGFCSHLSLLWNQFPWPLSHIITLVSVVFLPAFCRNLNAPLLKLHPVWPVVCCVVFLIQTPAFEGSDRSHGGAALIRNNQKCQASILPQTNVSLHKINTTLEFESGDWRRENKAREVKRSHTVNDRLSWACHYSLWRLRQENSRQARCSCVFQITYVKTTITAVQKIY